MLHKLSLDVYSKAGNIISFGERILLDFETRNIGLSNSMVQPMKLRCLCSTRYS